MKVTVHHLGRRDDGHPFDRLFGDQGEILTPATPEWPRHYTKVAEVEVHDEDTPEDACEGAFCATNHIDRPWWENANALRIGPPTRSTSVGDVVVVNDTPYRVAPCGFTRVE